MKVLAIILNYKTYELTLNLIQELNRLDYEELDVLVVDNCSPNESAKVLAENAEKLNYIFITNDRNAGYAAGNNIGIRYAIENGYDYSWILNNDVKIEDEKLLCLLLEVAKSDRNIGAIGPKIIDIDGYTTAPYVKRQSFWDMTFGIFGARRNREKYQDYSGEVYRIYGCCMLLNNAVMKAVDCMDERTFLYCEEEILAERMKMVGATTYYCANASIIHMESMTVQKAYGKRDFKKVKIVLKSMDLYLKEYRKFGFFKRLLCEIVRGGIILLRG